MSPKMRALRLFAPADLRCETVDIPTIQTPDQVLIKIKSSGVCGSDIPRVMKKGTYRFPTTIGHEFAGEIIETGACVTQWQPGDRVTVMPLIPCGKCQYCLVGDSHLCDDYNYYGSRCDGAMAEYIAVEAKNCLRLPDNVDYEMGSMTDPVSVGLHAVRRAKIEAGSSAVVFGLGAIGYIAMQWLKALGCTDVIVVDVDDSKLQLALELGATAAINGRTEDAVERIRKLTNQQGAHVAIEMAGNKITHVQAIQSVRKSGQVVFCGITYDDVTLPNSAVAAILRGELTIRGSWNSSINPLPINEWESALKFMSSGQIQVKPLITHRLRLEEGPKAFQMMLNRTETFSKVLFKPEI